METSAHILVVDDDRDIRQLVGDYLRQNGYRVSLAAHGKEMRSLLEASRIDLIVLDLMLPGEDGLSLCRNVRANPVLALLMSVNTQIRWAIRNGLWAIAPAPSVNLLRKIAGGLATASHSARPLSLLLGRIQTAAARSSPRSRPRCPRDRSHARCRNSCSRRTARPGRTRTC